MTTYSYLDRRQKYGRPQAIIWSENAGRQDVDNDDKIVPYGYEVNAATGSGSGVTITTQDPVDAFMILPDHNRSSIDVSFERLEQRQRMVNGRMRSFHVADKRKISMSWSMLPSRAFADNPNFQARVGEILGISTNGSTVTFTTNSNFVDSLIPNATRLNITGIIPTVYNLSNVLVTAIDAGNNTFSIASTLTDTYVDGGFATATDIGVSPVAINQQDQYIVDGGAGAADILDWYENHTGSFYVFLSYDKPANLEGNYNRLNEYSEVVEMFISDFSYNIVKRGANNYDFWDISVTLEEV